MPRLTGTLLLILCLINPAAPRAAQATNNPFIEAMRTMMRMMGMLNDDPYPWLNPFTSTPTTPRWPVNPMNPGGISPYGMMMPGMASGMLPGMPLNGVGQYYQQGRNWMRQMPMQQGALGGLEQALPGASSALMEDKSDTPEGKWRGSNGEWLIIARGMFRLYVSRDRYVEGDVRFTDRWISFRNNDNQTVKTYEYAVRDGRMILKDEDGNLLLFKL